jgi:hypothetical protein
MATSVRTKRRVSLKDSHYAYPELKCVAEEGNEICGMSVRNKKMMLCAKHYGRFQRHGTTVYLGVNPDTKAENRTRREYEQQSRIDQGHSIMCFCTHIYSGHTMKGKCSWSGCNCKAFDSINEELLQTAMDRYERLGFARPVNAFTRCLHCDRNMRLGHWTDPLTINRLREHSKQHLRNRRIVRAGSPDRVK